MPRNMSFMLTTEQMRNRTKTVTRRLGWEFLKAGDIVNASVKCQGIPKWKSFEKICEIRIIDVRREPLDSMLCMTVPYTYYGESECIREGFPHKSPREFVEMFCKHMKCEPDQEVTRIEFNFTTTGNLMDNHAEMVRNGTIKEIRGNTRQEVQ